MPDVSLTSIETASPAAADKVLGVKGGVAKQLDAGPSFGQLVAAGGSALAGHVASGTGAVTRTVQAKLRETVSVTDFGAVGDGVTDDTAAFVAATVALAAGGTLHVPTGKFILTGLVTLAANTVLSGEGFRATVIKQTGAFFAVKVGLAGTVRDITIEGTATATGGLDISNCGLGYVHFVEVFGFSSVGAVAIKLHESYRIKLSYLYIRDNYTALKFSGNVTAFKFDKGNVSLSSYRAIDASGTATGNALDGNFNAVYFESNYGLNPIYCDHTGGLIFTECGFEVNCGIGGANPKVIRVENPTHLTLRSCTFSEFTNVVAYTGTAYYIYLGDNAPRLVMDDCSFVHNFAIAGYTLRLVRSAQTGTVQMTNNRLYGTAITTDMQAQAIMLGGFNVNHPPRTYNFANNRARNAYVQRASPTAITTAVATSDGTSSTLYSRQFPAGAFHKGAALKIKAWGRRTGTAGVKGVQLGFVANTLSTHLMTAAVTAADAWVSDLVLLFKTYSAQSLSVMAQDGTAAYTASTQLAKDTNAYDTTIVVLAVCSNAADSITLDGLVIEWL